MAVFPCGDVTCDGNVNRADASLVRNHWSNPQAFTLCNTWAADVNGNDEINRADASLIRNKWGLGYPLNCCTCKVFATWINDYEPFLPNTLYCDVDAVGFYTELCDDTYWEGAGIYGNDNAKERHWKDPIYDGSDIADNAEFAYFSGHGTATCLNFNTTEDDHYLAYYDALWGNDKMNWIAISSCRVLNESSHEVWEDAFEGLHTILGYDTGCCFWSHRSRGECFAQYMDGTLHEYTIINAWFYATKWSEDDPSIWAAAYTAHVDGTEYGCWDDHLYSHGSSVEPLPSPPKIWYQHWSCEW